MKKILILHIILSIISLHAEEKLADFYLNPMDKWLIENHTLAKEDKVNNYPAVDEKRIEEVSKKLTDTHYEVSINSQAKFKVRYKINKTSLEIIELGSSFAKTTYTNSVLLDVEMLKNKKGKIKKVVKSENVNLKGGNKGEVTKKDFNLDLTYERLDQFKGYKNVIKVVRILTTIGSDTPPPSTETFYFAKGVGEVYFHVKISDNFSIYQQILSSKLSDYYTYKGDEWNVNHVYKASSKEKDGPEISTIVFKNKKEKDGKQKLTFKLNGMDFNYTFKGDEKSYKTVHSSIKNKSVDISNESNFPLLNKSMLENKSGSFNDNFIVNKSVNGISQKINYKVKIEYKMLPEYKNYKHVLKTTHFGEFTENGKEVNFMETRYFAKGFGEVYYHYETKSGMEMSFIRKDEKKK